MLPDDLEELTTDVYYYFQKSPKRIREFEQFQAFVESKPHKLLKACQTRLLSLEACVNRLIEQYEALLSYFRSTEDRQAVVRRVRAVFEKPLTKAYLLFFSSPLPIINNFNKLMQRESPLVHILQQQLDGLVPKLLLRFMKQDHVCASLSVVQVDISNEYYLPLDEVFVGDATLQYLESVDEITTADLKKFRETCLSWWCTAAKEALKRLAIEHSLLNNIQWLQPGVQQYGLANQVTTAAGYLPHVVTAENIHTLKEEFMDYCLSPLPLSLKTMTEVDKCWHAVSQLQDLDGATRYLTLTTLAKAILVIPHGNADTERLFSHVGLDETKLRNSLSLSTLNALLVVQFNRQQNCFEFRPSNELLRRCRNAISEVQEQ